MIGIRDDLIGVASDLTENRNRIRVEWESARSDEIQSAVGHVTRVYVRDGGFELRFYRVEDTQEMWIEGDGSIYSVGSHFPVTGTVESIEVVSDSSE